MAWLQPEFNLLAGHERYGLMEETTDAERPKISGRKSLVLGGGLESPSGGSLEAALKTSAEIVAMNEVGELT